MPPLLGASTRAVWALEALEEPEPFDAVTATRIVEPTSAVVNPYVCAVAPATSLQTEPAASQRRH